MVASGRLWLILAQCLSKKIARLTPNKARVLSSSCGGPLGAFEKSNRKTIHFRRSGSLWGLFSWSLVTSGPLSRHALSKKNPSAVAK